MRHRIIPAIMSGGAGTRLWPVSTDAHPKQFQAIAGGGSLFAQTLARFADREHEAISYTAPIVLCNARHAAYVRACIAGASARLVLEPEPRNTGAVAAIAAALVAEHGDEALALLIPADHFIADEAAFHTAVARAAPFARDRIVTFGITPDRPDIGYGYIKSGAPLADGVLAIAHFKEKPTRAVAEGYQTEGGYLWNAGIFLFHPKVMLDAFEVRRDIRDAAIAALTAADRHDDEIRLDPTLFSKTPAASIDTAVMEHKGTPAAVVACDMGWADVGAWDEVWRLSAKDEAGNAVAGAVTIANAHNCLVRSEGVRVCVDGIDDLIVVATPQAVIVLPRERAQEVKALRESALKS